MPNLPGIYPKMSRALPGRRRAEENVKPEKLAQQEGRVPAVPESVVSPSACACGGGCPRCNNKPPVHTTLRASEPNDSYEQEADRVAEQVMRMPESRVVNGGHDSSAFPGNSPHQAPKTLQFKHVDTKTGSAGGISANNVLQSPGQPLDSGTRGFMESRFGHDFGLVRVHADEQADAAARSQSALAFTLGNNVVFRAGHYAPHSSVGRRLLAHELTHVVQQQGKPRLVQRQDDGEEPAAEEAGEDIPAITITIHFQPYWFTNLDGRFLIRIQSDWLAGDYYDYSPAQLQALYEAHRRPDIRNPVLPVERFIFTLESQTGLHLLPEARVELEARGRIPLENYGDFHYAAFINEPDLVRWFGPEQWHDYLTREGLGVGGAESEARQPVPDEESTAAETGRERLIRPFSPNSEVMEGNRDLSMLYLVLMQHFTSLQITPELSAMANDGITAEELDSIVGEDELRRVLTTLFTQAWGEFRDAGGDSTEIFGSLIERILEQYTRGNPTATANRLRVGHGWPERDVLGIVHAYTGYLLYDELGMPIRSTVGLAWRDPGFIGFAVSEEETREGMESEESMTLDDEVDVLMANLFSHALGVSDTVMVAQAVEAALRHIDDVKRRVEEGLTEEVLSTVGETIGVLVFFMLGHALARFLMRSPNPYAVGVGIGIEVFLRGAGYILGIEFLADTWDVLLESAFHLSRVRDNEEGVPTALSQLHMDQAAEPVRHLINNTAAAMTAGAFALAVRGVNRGRRATWGRQRGRGDWRTRTLALRLLLETGRGVREGIGAESFEGYGSSSTPAVEAPVSGSGVEVPEAGAETVRGGGRPTGPQTGARTPDVAEPATVESTGELGQALDSPIEPVPTEAAPAETVRDPAELFGERLVRIFLDDPESFDADVLSPQHRRAMFDAFVRNPEMYMRAAETDAGDTLLTRLAEEAMASERASTEDASPGHALDSPATIETAPGESTATEPAEELSPPTPTLDPSTRVTVNLRSNIYYPPGTRYYGTTGSRWADMTLAEAQARGARSTRLRSRTTVPSGVYQVERPTEGNPRVVLRAWLGWREARAGLERLMMSAGEYAVSVVQGWQRAHASGAGLGAESGEAIRLAPEFVNQALQNRGIERFLRDLRDRLLPEGGQIHVTTIVETHPRTLRLRSIEYRIETMGESGRLEPLADVVIEVTPEGNSRGGVRMPGSDTYTYTPEFGPNGEPVRGGTP